MHFQKFLIKSFKIPVLYRCLYVIYISESCLGDFSVGNLGDQKLNDFSVGEAKIGEKQSRQSNSKYAICIFRIKSYTQCTMGSGAPQKLGNFRQFCVKSTVSYRKNGGAGCILVVPPVILLGELPRFRACGVLVNCICGGEMYCAKIV